MSDEPRVYITTRKFQRRVRYNTRGGLPDLIKKHQWNNLDQSPQADGDDDEYRHEADICL